MYYDKQIRYIDYLENGEKQRNCGYVKMTVTDNLLRLEMQIKGLYETDDVASEVALEGAGAERRIGTVLIRQGSGSFRWELKDPVHGGEALAISQGLCYGQLERIHVQLSSRRSLRCVWRETVPAPETAALGQEYDGRDGAQGIVPGAGTIPPVQDPVGSPPMPMTADGEAGEPTKDGGNTLPERDMWREDAPRKDGGNTPPERDMWREDAPRKDGGNTPPERDMWREDVPRKDGGNTPPERGGPREGAPREDGGKPLPERDMMREDTPRKDGGKPLPERGVPREGAPREDGGKPLPERDMMREDTPRKDGGKPLPERDVSRKGVSAEDGGKPLPERDMRREDAPKKDGENTPSERDVSEESASGRGGEMSASEGAPGRDRAEGSKKDRTEAGSVITAGADRTENGTGNRAGEKARNEAGSGTEHVAKEAELRQTDVSRMSAETEAARDSRQASRSPHMASLSEDKWQQLWKIYPHIRPFQDEREYISLRPEDFVILHSDAYRLVQNSFLLHGYFNYDHLILTQVSRRNGNQYYIGVPGNFYDKEKQVAVMYGFGSFECRQEPAREGDFGYYMIKVEL